jgi:hypothetical protein
MGGGGYTVNSQNSICLPTGGRYSEVHVECLYSGKQGLLTRCKNVPSGVIIGGIAVNKAYRYKRLTAVKMFPLESSSAGVCTASVGCLLL